MAAEGEASDKARSSPAKNFAERASEVSKWAVGALAAAGTFAVSKLSFDRLGKGDYGDHRAVWAFTALTGLAVGVAILVVAVVWTARAGRVTLGYLRVRKRFIGKQVRERIESSPYLLNGKTSMQDFVDELNALITDRAHDPVAFGADEVKRRKLAIALNAKQDVLDTARAERAARVNAWASALLLVAAVVVTLSAATYGYVTNRAEQVQAEQDEEDEAIVTGELRPATPSSALLVVPGGDGRAADLRRDLGADCDLRGVAVIVLDVATPPAGVPDDAVVRTVTERTEDCAVAEVWVPPGWLTARPPKAAPTTASPARKTTTSDPAEG